MLRLLHIRSSGRTVWWCDNNDVHDGVVEKGKRCLGTRRRGPTSRHRADLSASRRWWRSRKRELNEAQAKGSVCTQGKTTFCCLSSVFGVSQHTLLRVGRGMPRQDLRVWNCERTGRRGGDVMPGEEEIDAEQMFPLSRNNLTR